MFRRFIALLVVLCATVGACMAQDTDAKKLQIAPEVKSLTDKAYRAYRKGNLKEARDLYEEALAKSRSLKDQTSEVASLNSFGVFYDKTGQPLDALELYRQALPLVRSLGDKLGEAKILLNIGVAQMDCGEIDKSLDGYKQALMLFRMKNSTSGIATALSNIGIVYRNLGQYQTALEYYQQALQLRRENKNSQGETICLLNIGNIYNSMGQLPTALNFMQQALSLCRQIGDTANEASALNGMGIVYKNQKEYDQALDCYQKALPLYRQLGNVSGEASTVMNIGVVYRNRAQYQTALDYYQQALTLYRKASNKNGEMGALGNLGVAYKNLDQIELAVGSYQQSLSLARQLGDSDAEANALKNLGLLAVSTKHPKEAIDFFQQSLAVYEKVRGGIGGNAENRQTYLATMLNGYTHLVSILLEQKQEARAFAVVQKMKGRTLLEQSVNKTSLAGVPAEAQSKLRALRQECDKLSLRLTGSRRNKSQEDAIKSQLAKAEQGLNIEQDALFAKYPGAAQKNGTQTITLPDVSAFLPDDTALLEYVRIVHEAEKKQVEYLLLFVITREAEKPVLTVHTLRVAEKELHERAETLREACSHSDKEYRSAATALSATLLPRDVLARLTGKRRLIVCPDSAVWSVPFAVLMQPDGKHFIEQYEIDYSYSATGAQAAFMVPYGKAEGSLIVANPDFGDSSRFGDAPLPEQVAQGKERPLSDPARPLSDPARLVEIMERGRIKPLPGTKREADAIAKLYPNAILMTGKQAQEAELVKVLPNYRYLHFATHGLFSDTAPLQSAIVLAQPPKDSQDDGFLTAREIYEMNLNAEMAVLSACETARGVNTGGEGIVGLTWALFAAGVPTQVVSQWKVSDASTPELMTAFYGNLKNGQKKGQALRNAALTMMRDGKHSHPYHWASFVLFGDWR